MREMHSSARNRSAHNGSGLITPRLRISRERSTEYDRFLEIIAGCGAEIVGLPQSECPDSRFDLHARRVGSIRRWRDPLQHGEAGSSRRARRTGSGAAPAGLAHRGSPCATGIARRWRSHLARRSNSGGGRRPPNERGGHSPVANAARWLIRRAHCRAAAGISRPARRHALDVAHQPRRPTSRSRVLPAPARIVPKAASRSRLFAWSTFPTKSSRRWA